MNKAGYKNKFIKLFFFMSFGLYFLFLYTSDNFSLDAVFGQYIFSALYAIIPAAFIALIWEFFDEK